MADGYNPAAYEGSRRTIEYDYNRNAANNAYGRFLSQQRGSRQLGDMSRQYNQAYPNYRASFGQRGLGGPGVNSGVQRNAMQRFVGDYTRDYGRAQQDMNMELQQYDLGDQQLDQWRQGALADLELQRQNEIAQAAANIAALRQYLGGV